MLNSGLIFHGFLNKTCLSCRPLVATRMIEIIVGQNNLEKAMRVLKRKLIREGVFKELKSRRFYEKPSEKNKRKRKEAHKKRRKEQDRMRRFSY